MHELVRPRHPLLRLLPYLIASLLINGSVVLLLAHLTPDSALLLIRFPGVLMGISWGWAGLVLCVFVGIVMGLPVVAFQGAYVALKLSQIAQGADFHETLGNRTAEAILIFPWFVAAAVGYVFGYFWVFPPLGGPLIAANILWVRLLLYRQHLWIYAYEKAYLQQQQEMSHQVNGANRSLA